MLKNYQSPADTGHLTSSFKNHFTLFSFKIMPERNVAPPSDRPVSDETLLKVAKEIVIKFIEVGRLTPATFEQTFDSIYSTIKNTVRKG